MKYPPGVVGVTSNYIGRYSEFHFCMRELQIPAGSRETWRFGINIAQQCNQIIRSMPSDAEWVWFIDDDQVFAPDVLLRLLERDVDIVCPLILRRDSPHTPVIYAGKSGGWKSLGWEPLRSARGLIEIESNGKSGMLIKRKVLELMIDPWFEMGQTKSEVGGMDLWFCEKAREAGFKVHLDTDTHIGHMTHRAVWPERRSDGSWSARFCDPMDTNPRPQRDPVFVVGVGRSGTSMVAGMLHRLGVHMGDTFKQADEHNQYGYYEDLEFRNAVNVAVAGRITLRDWHRFLRRYVEKRQCCEALWGVKHPAISQVLPSVLGYVESPKFVWCQREEKQVVVSLMKAYNWTEESAYAFIRARETALREHTQGYDVLMVPFDQEPKTTVKQLCDFLGIDPKPSARWDAVHSVVRETV